MRGAEMTEKEFLIQSFQNNFAKYYDKRIVIYGISNSTKIILDNIDQPILGLMDGQRTTGRLYGKRILSCDDVVKLNTELIIVVARTASVKIITSRIAEFCKANQIQLYDINGTDLLKKYESVLLDDIYFNVNKLSLLDEIDQHDVISFDIFDTMLMRRVLYPADVFSLVEQRITKKLSRNIDFLKVRTRSEQVLLSGPYPSIDMIYEVLRDSTGLTDEETEYLKELELAIEEEVIVPRIEMVHAFQYACQKSKAVYLISDMYIPKVRMERILKKCGIEGYHDLLISCEYGTMKTQHLFREYKKIARGETYLHIGDNEEADIQHARKNGIDAFFIASARHMLSISSYRNILELDHAFSRRIMIGIFAERLFNNPFALYHSCGKPRVSRPYDIGYLFVAPLTSVFIHWIIRQFENTDYDKVLFLARDGYILEKLYNWAIQESRGDCQYPDGIYFLTSRIACIAATQYDEKDIFHGVSIGHDGSPEWLLKNRFLLEEEEIMHEPVTQDPGEFVLRHKEKILSKSEEQRIGYERYISRMGIKPTDAIAVVDFAASGTCQRCLQEMLKTDWDGYYFIHIRSEDKRYEKLKINSLYKISSWFKNEAFICESYIVLESILSSYDPSLKGFNTHGNPVFIDENRDDIQLENLRQIQQGIMDYFKQYWALSSGGSPEIDIADRLLNFIRNSYTDLGSVSIIHDALFDDFFNRKYHFNDILK